MTYAQCLSDARDLKATMERWGVACSIELQSGRGADPWLSATKYLRMHHHTASYYRPGGSLTPILGVVKNGRSDVPGPLANGYGGFDRVYRIICMGEANHPGRGGPITIDGVHIPLNSARRPTWGTEWEGGYQDYETIPGMLEFMGRADNALAEWSRRSVLSQLEHSTWAPTRKIDRRGFTRERGIALSQQWGGGKSSAPAPTTQEKYKMPYPVIFCRDRGPTYWVLTENGPKQVPGGKAAYEFYQQGVAAKVLQPVQDLSGKVREFDVRYSLCRDLALAPAGK